MLTIKVQCGCGQRYSFDVDAGADRIPVPVQCPVCGADGTEAANEQLKTLRAAQSPPVLKPRMSMPVQPDAPPVMFPGTARTTVPSRPLPEVPVYENAAMASNPGRLWVSWGRVFSTYRLEFAILFVLGFAGLAMGIVIHPSLFILAVAGFWSVFSKCRLTKWKFISGDVCPGVILSESPPLIAVKTNLSAVGGNNPAVRIFRQRLKGMTGGPPCAGMRVATVAHYLGSRISDDDVWKDFDPEVINCCATDELEIQRVFDSIPEKDWTALYAALEQLPVRKVGLYRLWGRAGVSPGQHLPAPAPAGTAPPRLTTPRETLGTPYGGLKSALNWRKVGFAVAVAISIVVAMAKRWPQIEKKLQERKGSSQTFPTPTDMFPQRTKPAPGSERATPPDFRQPQVTPTRPTPMTPSRPTLTRPTPTPPVGTRGVPGLATGAPGEKVEVQWGATWYPATVVKREGVQTLIHYDGYGTNWDEWVTPGRIRAVR